MSYTFTYEHTMTEVKVESFTRCFQELQPLLVAHWKELALNQEQVPLDPCWDIYLQRDHEGGLLFVTVRDAGQLLGYFIGFVAPGLHYRSCRTLQMDIFWLHPDLRDGDSLDQVEGQVLAQELFEQVHQEAKRRGAQRIFVGTKSHKDASLLFARLGYAEVERYHSLWLGD